jgi:flagellin-specific chaperone FliS
MEVAVFGFMGIIIGAILVFLGTLVTAFGKSKDTQLDVLTKVITSERAQWRNDMRVLGSELVSLLNQKNIKDDNELLKNFHQTRVKLRLRLNPNEGHELDVELLTLLRGFSDFVAKADKISSVDTTKLEDFEFAIQKLIKKEWDKSKKETESGNLGKADKHT